MNTIQDLELVSIETCDAIIRKDESTMTTDVKAYRKDNRLSYYILLNTWMHIIRDLAGHVWSFVLRLALQKGLIAVINEFQAYASALIKHEELPELAMILLQGIRQTAPQPSIFNDTNVSRDAFATLLMILRYPKRFSPTGNDKIKSATIADFIATENRSKLLQRREYSYFIIQYVAQEVQMMYPWEEICSHIRDLQPCDIMLSSGSCYDANDTLLSKLRALASHESYVYFKPIMGRMRIFSPDDWSDKPRHVKALAVPKSYKAARIVALEDTYRQGMGKAVEHIFRRYDGSDGPMDLTDQTINQHYAELGSRDGELATLDASHASDMISKSLFRSIFPKEFIDLVDPLLAEYVDIGDKVYTLQMCSTSGHSLTFRLETIVYKAIAQAAARFQYNITGSNRDAWAWAYGDDVIVRSDTVEMTVAWYTRLGLVINTDKSFWGDSDYRESCGKEYRRGIDVSSLYYPRFPIVGTIDSKLSLDSRTYRDEYRGKIDNSTTMLIDLQKKLFPVSQNAAFLVLDVLRQAHKRLTTSRPGQICTDPWGYVDTGYVPQLHAYEIVRYQAYFGIEVDGHVYYHRLGKKTSIIPMEVPVNQADRKVLDEEHSKDKLHSLFKVSYTSKGAKTSNRDRELFDIYRYWEFLRHGPKYDSPLDELLGVSSPPMTFDQCFGHKTLVMVRK